MVLFDFVGFGLSAKPDVRYSIRRYADQAAQVARYAGLESVVLLTHDMGDTVGGELLARDLEGQLDLTIEARVLTNGSIYIEMAHLTPGQQFLLSLDDARVELPGGTDDPGANFKAGVGSTFASAHPATDEEMAAQWELVAYNAGNTLMARTIRYIEDRRAEEITVHGCDRAAPVAARCRVGGRGPGRRGRDDGTPARARPGTPLVILDDVGHYPMVEAPDRFTDALFDVLAAD